MPVKRLPSQPSLHHLRQQARDLQRSHAARDLQAAQRLREFHPRFHTTTDAAIFAAPLKLAEAQLALAREHGFSSWPRLKAHIEAPSAANNLELPHQECIVDPAFRHAVALIDNGDAAALRVWLEQHPRLIHQHVTFDGGNYFRTPTLLEFIAENPVRRGTLPPNIAQVTGVLLEFNPSEAALDETLMLVATSSVARECGVQLPLINLLCAHGAAPGAGAEAAALHGEFAAVHAFLARGLPLTLTLAAALGRAVDFAHLLHHATSAQRHLALTLAADHGHLDIIRMLLDAGEDPDRYNPVGGHSHTTPLHQAAWRGHTEVVRLFIARGARLDLTDALWQGTPADWAHHGDHPELEAYLRAEAAKMVQPAR